MRFLNFISIDPVDFMYSLSKTSDIELLSKIQELSMELSHYWTHGIPKYEGKMPLSKECIEAKKELLTTLLNEYQIRRCLTD
jgi:hypothetical protein